MRRALVAVVIGVLVLEAGLQIASLLARSVGSTSETAAPPGTVRILLVGDSHAAGAGVQTDHRLSDHLQRMLSARHPGRAFQVVNLGRAGVNSAYVANRLEANLIAYRPQVVIVWAGVNDVWNTLETESWPSSDPWLRLQRLLLRSKVYRLLSVTWTTHGRETARGPYRWQARGEELVTVGKGLAFDLERMVRTTHALRIPMLFMNYPVPYEVVNPTISTTGARLAVPVVNSAIDVWRAKADGHPKEALLTFAAGPHPTGLLYRYVAESTVPHVEMLLRQADVDLPGK